MGDQGEARALAYLQQQGLRLVARNHRIRGGEIDLIMQDGTCLVFVEVRCRNNSRFGGAAASITASKQARLWQAATQFLSRYATPPPCRFDAVLLERNQITWLKNIIQA